MEYENSSDISNNRGNGNHPKIIEEISEQHTGKARNQGTTKKAILGTAHILWKVLM